MLEYEKINTEEEKIFLRTFEYINKTEIIH